MQQAFSGHWLRVVVILDFSDQSESRNEIYNMSWHGKINLLSFYSVRQ